MAYHWKGSQQPWSMTEECVDNHGATIGRITKLYGAHGRDPAWSARLHEDRDLLARGLYREDARRLVVEEYERRCRAKARAEGRWV